MSTHQMRSEFTNKSSVLHTVPSNDRRQPRLQKVTATCQHQSTTAWPLRPRVKGSLSVPHWRRNQAMHRYRPSARPQDQGGGLLPKKVSKESTQNCPCSGHREAEGPSSLATRDSSAPAATSVNPEHWAPFPGHALQKAIQDGSKKPHFNGWQTEVKV